MKMTEPDKPDFDLDELFDAARSDAGPIGDPLTNRILTDAARVQAAWAMRRKEPAGFAQQIGAAFGGWMGVGGLVSAGLVGIWLGFAPLEGVPDLAMIWTGETTEIGFFPADDLVTAMLEDQ
jgi:hypothetical protein